MKYSSLPKIDINRAVQHDFRILLGKGLGILLAVWISFFVAQICPGISSGGPTMGTAAVWVSGVSFGFRVTWKKNGLTINIHSIENIIIELNKRWRINILFYKIKFSLILERSNKSPQTSPDIAPPPWKMKNKPLNLQLHTFSKLMFCQLKFLLSTQTWITTWSMFLILALVRRYK